MNSIDSLLAAMELDPEQGLTTISASRLTEAYFPPLNPDLGALVIGIDSAQTAKRTLEILRSQYPRDHPVLVYPEPGASVLDIPLEKLPSDEGMLAIYLPALGSHSSFESLQGTVAHLRSPEGCPWDLEQTHRSLRKHLLEEAYETLEALDQADMDSLREELGDLLLQIIMHAQIAQEAGTFRMGEVVSGIQAKLIRRHPHVFGDLEVADVDQVLSNWEHYKREEKDGGPLDGVPATLPALAQSAELQDRAGRAGFEWPADVQAIVHGFAQGTEEEQLIAVGDLLFAIVNYARGVKLDAEAELQRANQQFRRQFSSLLRLVGKTGRRLGDLETAELIEYWNGIRESSI